MKNTKNYDRVRAEISMSAIEHNFAEMRKNIAPDTKMIAVIKADGYGHGAVPIAHTIENYDYLWGFAVATAEEALELKEAGLKKPVLILGLVFEEYYPEMVAQDVRLNVCTFEAAKKLSAEAGRQGKNAILHLSLDTGMSRIGFADVPESIDEIKKIAALPHVEIEGMFTHFARADETDKEPAVVQLGRYMDFAEKLEAAGVHIPMKHCSNSAGIIRLPEANLNAVRAGITIYGIYPSSEVERDIVRLKPVMELKSHISYVKTLRAGVSVSYGGTFTAKEDMQVATIPVGYADGYPRMLSGKAHVLIRGKKAPILGRVCMDQFMVDVSKIPEVKEGDAVTLIGRDGNEFISIETLGDISGRFSYELACCIGKRVPRVYCY